MAKFPVAVHGKIYGRSPQDVVAVHPRMPWPFTSRCLGRSPQDVMAVHLFISNGRSLKIGCFFELAVHLVRSRSVLCCSNMIRTYKLLSTGQSL